MWEKIVLGAKQEIARKVLEFKHIESFARSREYWVGWTTTYYQ